MTEVLAADDLDAYLRRIGHAVPVRPDLATLVALHGAHVEAIPFENLDVRWGKPIALDLPSLVAKLVRGGRGGYCFEQNGLFAAVLRAIGFDVVALGARVRLQAARTLPRTHQLLLVTVDGERAIADVGFGAQTLLAPIPLRAGESFAQAAWRYELVREDELWVLRMGEGHDAVDLYAFTLEAQLAADLGMANWYVSTHPDSRFVQTLTVQRAARGARQLLRNRTYTVDRGGSVTVAELTDEAIIALVRDGFGLRLPAGMRLPLPTA